MKIECLTVGPFQMNCYLVYNPETRIGVVLDPGDEIERISGRIRTLGLTLTHILLTHGHIDHLHYAEDLHQELGVPMLLHQDDWEMAGMAAQQALMFGLQPGPLPQIDGPLEVQPDLPAGSYHFEVRHTPGHSPGSVTLVSHQHKLAFVGDVIFQQGIGRTDLPGASHRQLMETIQREILTLPDTYVLFPGHGPRTTVGAERADNPFLTNLV